MTSNPEPPALLAASRGPALAALCLALSVAPAGADDVVLQLDPGGAFVLLDATATTERLRIDEATGNVSRNGALFLHTTGADSTFLGEDAGTPATTGSGNSALGHQALLSNTTGSGNSAMGRRALRNNTTGSYNSAFGQNAMSDGSTGAANSAFGVRALMANQGSRNSAFGVDALQANLGDDNSALGEGSLAANTSGSGNSALGNDVLASNTTGGANSAFGARALEANTTGFGNTAFGGSSLRSATVDSYSTALGGGALAYSAGLYPPASNTALGTSALVQNTTGQDNTAVGSALAYNTTGSNNTAIGGGALSGNTTGTHNVAIGSGALSANTTGQDNVAVGRGAYYDPYADPAGANNVTVGNDTTHSVPAGSYSICIGNDEINPLLPGECRGSGSITIGRRKVLVPSLPPSYNTVYHTQTTIAGIHGSFAFSGATGVLINSDGELGTTTSSIRGKRDVRSLEGTGKLLERLRPVVFRYREEVADDPEAEQYGLIAEEVAEVAPELVAYDARGRPHAVRYHLLAPLVLAEWQSQAATIRAHDATIAELEAEAARLEAGRSAGAAR